MTEIGSTADHFASKAEHIATNTKRERLSSLSKHSSGLYVLARHRFESRRRAHASDMIQKGGTSGDQLETSAAAGQQMNWWVTDADRRGYRRRPPHRAQGAHKL
jgi:hypothetical protein